jgi:hypothetical protein
MVAITGHWSYVFVYLYAFDGHRSITYINLSPSFEPYKG